MICSDDYSIYIVGDELQCTARAVKFIMEIENREMLIKGKEKKLISAPTYIVFCRSGIVVVVVIVVGETSRAELVPVP